VLGKDRRGVGASVDRHLAYVSEQLGHANPSITLRIYSHWVPGMRRVTTAVLDREKNASNLQAQAFGKEFGDSQWP